MKQVIKYLAKRRNERGQSLVEVALFMPIILILVVGILEVSNLLLTQNRVASASEAGTSFGAANFHEGDWVNTAGWSQAMAAAATANVTQTLDLSPERWDIYTVKATMASDGTFNEWVPVHAYGQGSVVSAADWSGTYEPQIRQDMLAALNSEVGSLSNDGLQVVSTIAYHNRNSLLGLDGFNVGEFTRVRGFAVRRVDDPQVVAACPMLPIVVNVNQYSMYPTNWDPDAGPYLRVDMNDPQSPPRYPNDPVDPTHQFFNPESFDWPATVTPYMNAATAPNLAVTTWVNNTPGVPLREAQPGYIYLARDTNGGSGGYPGNFGWLSWDGSTSADDARDSLNYDTRGNFVLAYPGGNADQNNIHNFSSYVSGEASGDGDGWLEVNEWVETGTGNMYTLAGDLGRFENFKTPVLLPVFGRSEGTGSNTVFKVAGFVKVQVIGYKFSGNDRWLAFEFIEWANGCN